MSPDAPARPTPAMLGWSLLAILVGYTFLVHQGVGPEPRGGATEWFQPREFFYDWDWLTPLVESPVWAMLGFGGVALALALAVATLCGSSLASAVAASCVVAVVLFAFYGVQASDVWNFFQWRGSAVISVTSAVVGFALAAPWLAASWLRLGWLLRIAVYLPIFLGVLAFMRNATGTDPALRFNISPWPAVPVFGIELGATFIATVLVGATLGATGLARAQNRSGRGAWGVVAASLALGVAVPAGLLWLGGRAELLPFSIGIETLAAVAAGSLTVTAGVAWIRRRGSPVGARARVLAVATALVSVPLLAGHALARSDYHTTRDRQAASIIDALQAYYERESLYPDSLAELVAQKDLREIPTPEIGFGFLYDADFEYQNFGTGYLLEFQAPRWVQCAYNPPWRDEDEEEYEGDGEDPSEDGSLQGAWSCPRESPKLW